jgi:hypothetical protein
MFVTGPNINIHKRLGVSARIPAAGVWVVLRGPWRAGIA